MKYFSLVFIMVLFLFTIFSYLKIKSTLKKLEEYQELTQVLQNDSKIFLFSLQKKSFSHSDLKIVLTTGDTIDLATLNGLSGFYLFSPDDCSTCTEENIFSIIGSVKEDSPKNFYIISTESKLHYLTMLSKAYSHKSLFFGYILGDSDIQVSHYFMTLNNGDQSNSFYPIRGNIESTKRYLNSMLSFELSELESNKVREIE